MDCKATTTTISLLKSAMEHVLIEWIMSNFSWPHDQVRPDDDQDRFRGDPDLLVFRFCQRWRHAEQRPDQADERNDVR